MATILDSACRMVSFTLAVFLIQVQRRAGVRTSSVQFVIWTLFSCTSILPFYFVVLNLVTDSGFPLGQSVSIIVSVLKTDVDNCRTTRFCDSDL